ncbi:MAG: hypothetical protein ABJC39_01120 [Chloroflexota bacterium]
MYELSLAHLNGADRERQIDANLRRRQLLAAPAAPAAPPEPTNPLDSRAIVMAGTRRPKSTLRTTER